MQDDPLSLQTVLERAEQLFADRRIVTATADGSQTRSVGDVVTRARRLVAALTAASVRQSDRVATFAWNTAAHLEVLLAVPAMGAVVVPVNVRLHAEDVGGILAAAQPRMVVIDPQLEATFAEVRVDPGVMVVTLGATSHGHATIEELLDGHAPAPLPPPVSETSAAAMCFTSGTTGAPKGVVYSHRSQVLHALTWMFADGLALGEGDTVMPLAPFFHAMGWGLPFSALLVGATLVLAGHHTTPADLAGLISTQGVTAAGGVPTVWAGLLEAVRAGTVDGGDLRTLRRVICGGAPVPRDVLTAYEQLGVRIIQGWGMTESSPQGTVALPRPTDGDAAKLSARLTQGRPLPLVDLRLVADDGSVLAWDGATSGELQIRGPWVAAAYANGGSPERFCVDGRGRTWLRTGDIAVIDAAGYVTVVDRAKDLIKSGGEWISSVQLEALLATHPAVVEVAVVAVADAHWGERPLACVVVRDDVSGDELRAHLAPHLASWQLPDRFEIVDVLPKTGVGKIDKKAVRARYSEPESWRGLSSA